jgi:hypothetical protein
MIDKKARRKEITISFLEKLKETSKEEVIFAQIVPEAICGFRTGDHLDFDLYKNLDFPHPKAKDNAGYYKINSNHEQSHKFSHIMEGIESSMSIDNPILIYLYEDKKGNKEILVLDGATRMSCIGYIKGRYPKSFGNVQVQLFVGTDDAARVEMMRRNLPGRTREISPDEMIEMAKFHNKRGVPHTKIAEMIGLTNVSHIASLINLDKRAGRKVIEAFYSKKLSIKDAEEISQRPEREQEKLLEKFQTHGRKVLRDERNIKSVTEFYRDFERSCEKVERNWKSFSKNMAEIEEESAALLAPYWERFLSTMQEFRSKFAVYEKETAERIIREQAPPKAIIYDDEQEGEFTIIEHDQWYSKYVPVKRDREDEDFTSNLPEHLAPYTLNPEDEDEFDTFSSAKTGTVWSVLENMGTFSLVLGLEDDPVGYIICQNPECGSIMVKEPKKKVSQEVFYNFDIEKAEAEVEAKDEQDVEEWSIPQVTAEIKDVIIGSIHRNRTRRPNMTTEKMLGIIMESPSVSAIVDGLIKSENLDERIERLDRLFFYWCRNERDGFGRYAFYNVRPNQGIRTYSTTNIRK